MQQIEIKISVDVSKVVILLQSGIFSRSETEQVLMQFKKSDLIDHIVSAVDSDDTELDYDESELDLEDTDSEPEPEEESWDDEPEPTPVPVPVDNSKKYPNLRPFTKKNFPGQSVTEPTPNLDRNPNHGQAVSNQTRTPAPNYDDDIEEDLYSSSRLNQNINPRDEITLPPKYDEFVSKQYGINPEPANPNKNIRSVPDINYPPKPNFAPEPQASIEDELSEEEREYYRMAKERAEKRKREDAERRKQEKDNLVDEEIEDDIDLSKI